jgi:citrate lyase subunit beta/citryl-CoA lyase
MRRSILFVPGNNERMLEKASTLKPDVVLLDLEDSVPEDDKTEARKAVQDALHGLTWKAREVAVRINGINTQHFSDDIKAVAASGFKLIAVPKVETAPEVEIIEKMIRKFSRSGDVPGILVMIETAKGLIYVEEILSSSSLLKAVEFGAEDFALSMGIHNPSRPDVATLYARSRIVAAAHAFGVDPIDNVFVDLKDQEGLRRSAIDAKNMGFVGKLVIHPSQIDVVNEAFSPSRDEMIWARRVIEAWNENRKKGRGAFRLDDRMIDLVHIKMAQQILEQADDLDRADHQNNS